MNYLVLGGLGLYFYFLSFRAASLRRGLITLFVVVVVSGSLDTNPVAMACFRDGKQRWKDCYLRTENVSECDSATGFRVYP